MTINNSFFPPNRNYAPTVSLRTQFDHLQQQLSTGEKFSSLSEVGNERVFDYNLRARISQLDSFGTSISTTNLRLDFLGNSVSRLEAIESDSRAAVGTAHAGADGLNMVTAKSQAEARLDEVLSIINGDINGRFMFAGDKTDSQPSVSSDLFLNGDGVRAGLRTIVSQRNQADLGVDGKGRLVTDIAPLTSAIPGALNIVTLTEASSVTSPASRKLTNITTDSAGSIAVSAPTGSPAASLSVTFTTAPTAPVAGEKITITLGMPDGSTQNRVFTAVSGAPANNGEFQIGATANDTAANFKAAMDAVLVSNNVTISKDGVHNFGLTPQNIATTSAGISLTSPSASPVLTSATVLAGAAVTGLDLSGTGSPASAGVYTAAAPVGVLDLSAANTLTFDISVDGAPAAAVTISGADITAFNPGATLTAVTAVDLAGAIAAKVGGGITADGTSGSVVLTSATPGAGSNVTISNVGGTGAAASGMNASAGTTGAIATPPDSISFTLNIDGTNKVISFTGADVAALGGGANASAVTADNLVALINADAGAAIASNDAGTIRFTSATSGTTSSIAITGYAQTVTGGTSGIANAAVTYGTAQPQVMSFQVDAQPVAGDKLTFSFTLPDGKVSSIELTAVTGTPLNKGEFQIGANTAATASNIKAALDTGLLVLGKTELKAASTYAATDNFVNGKGEAVMRVDGPNYATATTMSAASALNTVFWYTGGDAVGSARNSVSSRIDNNTVVNYGVQGNEDGILDMVRALGAMASSDFPPGDTTSRDHYAAMAREQYSRLSEANNSKPGSIEVMALELGVAKSSTEAAAQRHITYKDQLETMLAGIEATPMEEVAAQLLNIKTRLEASYQTMSILSQLTLVNYMR